MTSASVSRLVLATALLALACGCGGSPSSPTPPFGSTSGTLTGAGDISVCGGFGAEATAKLLDSLSGTVFTAGDNVQNVGARDEYEKCFEPTWGRHKSRIRPSPGNHDYRTQNGAPYREYFQSVLPPSGQTYYGYDVGGWRILALDSNIPFSSGSAQERWLRTELEGNRGKCVLAYWHHPLFSSGSWATPAVQPLWSVLYEFGVDVVVNGHDHVYERFAPQDPFGRPDDARGIRQFTVGTGGATLSGFVGFAANSQIRDNSTWGVVRFTLRPGSYDWEFIPVSGGSFRDFGTATCSF